MKKLIRIITVSEMVDKKTSIAVPVHLISISTLTGILTIHAFI
jgi:hypothetical protein